MPETELHTTLEACKVLGCARQSFMVWAARAGVEPVFHRGRGHADLYNRDQIALIGQHAPQPRTPNWDAIKEDQ